MEPVDGPVVAKLDEQDLPTIVAYLASRDRDEAPKMRRAITGSHNQNVAPICDYSSSEHS